MIRLIRISAIVALISLTACATQQSRLTPEGIIGSQLTVGSKANVPADDYSISFQKGQQVSQSDIVIWDHYCNIRFAEARPQSWDWTSGQYQITAYQWYPDACGWDDCDLVERYSVETFSGVQIEEMSCRYRYIFNDPVAIMGPDLLSVDRLDQALGDYVNLQ
jgi:hypothetical protein